MEEQRVGRDEAAQQAIEDQSVLDHLIATFPPPPPARRPRERARVRSAALYHQLRRDWSRAR